MIMEGSKSTLTEVPVGHAPNHVLHSTNATVGITLEDFLRAIGQREATCVRALSRMPIQDSGCMGQARTSQPKQRS